jgi:hypothetical protein
VDGEIAAWQLKIPYKRYHKQQSKKNGYDIWVFGLFLISLSYQNIKIKINMRKLLFIIFTITTLLSCADEQKRQSYLEKTYPHCKVEPATGLVQKQGFEFIVIDTNFQIVGVSFYPFSKTKISHLRNVR